MKINYIVTRAQQEDSKIYLRPRLVTCNLALDVVAIHEDKPVVAGRIPLARRQGNEDEKRRDERKNNPHGVTPTAE